eukprot:TRINITY_DN432_c0_g1_i1.p1 TRINITY_DN432_c0_g1~~TRINITY_DN432_c0_g1_i1.p1  ORF type:complete len:568 (+),score=110.27 TRINITY_DN432_c0_g1_i1:310-2013(+)
MYNGMMDPEMMRLAQEQMSRIPPNELAKIQQQMMSNPELMRLASESMKNLRPEDVRNAAEQLKYARAEDMVEISEKMSKATPEELAAIRARADAQLTYEINAAQMLKKQGNELHGQGKFHDAAQKYLLAKNNLKGVPISKGRALQLACSLNLMSCYLKTRQYEDCIKEGSEVTAYDGENVKALYRRGQAYKELGKLEAAVSDLSKAHELSPDDETIADVLRDANEKLTNEGGGLVIEEIIEEGIRSVPSECHNSSSTEYSVTPPQEAGECSQTRGGSDIRGPTSDAECLQELKHNPEVIRSFHNFISNTNLESMAALSPGGMSPDMIKTASDMIGKMSPEELQRMLEVASSLNGKSPFLPMDKSDTNSHTSTIGAHPSGIPPDMVKTASDMISKMPPEDLQKMLGVASSLNGKNPVFPTATTDTNNHDVGETSSRGFPNMGMDPSPSNRPTSTADLQDQMRNQMKDPAMRQMLSSMIKNMSPDMMANMGEQFGVKLTREEAAKAQQAMSSLSPDDLDRMMLWAERLQKAVDGARKAKNWLLGRPGMIFAVCMLILAIIFHRLGYIGG